MRPDPTPEQLQAALARLRALPCCAGWPTDVAAVQADPVRARLLRIDATLVARRDARRARQFTPATHRAPLTRPAPLFDRKRAAAGEREDD